MTQSGGGLWGKLWKIHSGAEGGQGVGWMHAEEGREMGLEKISSGSRISVESISPFHGGLFSTPAQELLQKGVAPL